MRFLLGLGSNLGDRSLLLAEAKRRMQAAGCALRAQSATVETEAVGWPGAPRFLNAVVEVEAAQSPWALLAVAKRVERELGRDPRAPRNAPRTIDIDLLAAVGLEMSSKELSLPHPRARGRAFVARPLVMLPDAALWRAQGLG